MRVRKTVGSLRLPVFLAVLAGMSRLTAGFDPVPIYDAYDRVKSRSDHSLSDGTTVVLFKNRMFGGDIMAVTLNVTVSNCINECHRDRPECVGIAYIGNQQVSDDMGTLAYCVTLSNVTLNIDADAYWSMVWDDIWLPPKGDPQEQHSGEISGTFRFSWGKSVDIVAGKYCHPYSDVSQNHT